MFIVALTGGIGSGKTTVSDIFKLKHIPVIDTDIIARQITEKGKQAYEKIVNLYGEEILDSDKNINRQALRNIIFSSEKRRLQLESILHPIIWDEVNIEVKRLSAASPVPPYCIIVVPLLIENLTKTRSIDFNRVLVIDAEEKEQLFRTVQRDNSNKIDIEKIMDSQVSRQTRIDVADDIILNSGDINSLKIKVEDLNIKYLKLSR